MSINDLEQEMRARADVLAELVVFIDRLTDMGFAPETSVFGETEVHLRINLRPERTPSMEDLYRDISVSGEPVTVSVKDPLPAPPAEPPRALKTGPWLPGEIDELKRLLDQGMTAKEIGEALDRSPQGVGALIGRIRRQEAAPEPVAPVPCEPQAGDPSGWTLQEDLALVEGLAKGLNLFEIGPTLPGRTVEDARLRFDALLPKKSISAQQKLLHDLRQRAGGA